MVPFTVPGASRLHDALPFADRSETTAATPGGRNTAATAGKPGRVNRSLPQVTGPADTAALIDQLRADGVVLTYDPGDRTLRAGDAPSVTIGRDATDVRPRRNKERTTA
jgi:hypothetical protein